MKSMLNLFDFFLFEGQQLEDFLNDMVKKGYHLQKIGRKIVFEKNDETIFYRVVTLHQKTNKENLDKLIDFFEESGFQFIDQYQYFAIFSSPKNIPVYTDEIFDQELFMKSSKKEFVKILLVYLLILMILSIVCLPITFEKLMNNAYIMGMFYGYANIILSLLFILVFYVSYFKNKKVNYHYRVCLLRGYIEKLFLLALLFSNALLFGTQNFLISVFVLLGFVVISFVCYKFSKNKIQPYLFQNLMRVTFIVLMIGFSMWGISLQEETVDFSKIPLYQEEIIEDDMKELFNHKRQSVFMDYYQFSRDHYRVEYVKIKDYFNDFVFDEFIRRGPVFTFQEEKQGYKIYKSEHLAVIHKNNHIIKYNFENIGDINKVINELNW